MKLSLNREIARRLAIPIAALTVLTLVGMTGYHLLERMSALDALYMSVITISTVGFAEVQELSAGGRIFTIGLIVTGGLVVAFSLGSIGEYLFSGEWQKHIKQRRRQKMLDQLNNHFIVCGFGRAGRNVARELHDEGLEIVVIEPKAGKAEAGEAAGYTVVTGDAAQESNLREAGIERARGLVTCASSDAENVFIVLTARSMRKDLKIVARADMEESEPKLLSAGADRVILPYRITGRRVMTMMLRPAVADFLEEITHTGGRELLLEQVVVAEGSPLIGESLRELHATLDVDVAILAWKTPGDPVQERPQPGAIIEAGALLIALGTEQHLQRLAKQAGGPVTVA